MPYVKKIELRGFKSFGPKTVTVTLDKGFTAVTGPNGSGKTNIVDAILFVLGELSARRMRAENLAKLIFHGSPDAGLGKAKSAKVVLQFDNKDGRIPVDTNTVTISREVFRNGQCVYRLNGRRISRTNINNMLSMAGITSTGHNIILQGTINRMTDISSKDRRKILEDMVGIAQYDSEKAEAEEKLQVAEISVRTAMGRIDEVQKRVDDLERERNGLLRYNFIQNEIKRFEAMKLSHQVTIIEEKGTDISSKLEEAQRIVENLGQVRDKMRDNRHSIEREWRRLSSDMVEEGGTRVLEVQIKIGDLKSRLTELSTKTSAGTTTLEGLRKVRENNIQQLDSMRMEISENRKRMQQLKRKREQLLKDFDAKQAEHDILTSETTQLWGDIGENSKEIRETERQLDRLYQELADLKADYAQGQTSKRILLHRLNDLKTRKERFAVTLEELEKSFGDLKEVQKEQKTRLNNLQKSLERRIIQKEAVEREIDEAGEIAGTAREAVVEFATQRELAEAVAAEENALRNIEELGELGVISGVYGRLKNLIKIEGRHKQALEAAGAGWLDAIVVRDFEAAFMCAETLRRLKLGRIRIIPIKGLTRKVASPRELRNVEGLATAFVKCAREHEPAVDFVFGDTVVARNDKTALGVCRKGYRSVTTNGDVYEVGGGLESGFFREPIDFSAIIPSETAIKSLDEAVRALKEHLARRGKDVSFLEEEIERTRSEITGLSEAIGTLDAEVARVKKSTKVTKRNIRRIGFYIQGVQTKLEKEKTEIGLQKAQRHAIRKDMQKLRTKLAELRRKTDPTHIQKLEIQRDRLAENLIMLRQNLGSVKTEFSTLQSKYDNVLRLSYRNVKVQLKKVEKQLAVVEKEIDEALQEKEQLKEELLKLEKSREELSRTVLSAREEAKKFTAQIDDIDKELKKIDAEYERADRLRNQLQLSHQTLQLQADGFRRQLREFGYEKIISITPRQLEEAETSLRMMEFEVERLGAVNQLALSHYAEQISRYKELSLRMNELEREKQSIIAFMNEVERKKRAVFMEAFEKINKNLRRYFLKVTDGGNAQLKLVNPEDPFSGGIDMIVQFPGKQPLLVSGASGGERSVSAVAFLLAIQELTPAAFYILDEVDAHLDALHVAKLGELLAEEADKSQFIVVTLKPEMVNKAQKIYGVYERNGVSNVVSTMFTEAKS
ncbi:chromosome segregation protein SMC [Candidatus Bathyarchaeota archaeon]|nr:chromosome segregation protein SMC [Candidatus Bathyarchaeota archaeon]